jgi:two-component system, NarL family, sensor histidine kinase DegS
LKWNGLNYNPSGVKDMMQSSVSEAGSSLSNFSEQVTGDLDQKYRELKELGLLLDQSQAEMNKLTQRNASIAAQLQRVQTQLETVPRTDIRTIYDAALETQQRMLMLRGQLEKLQSDRVHIRAYVSLLENIQELLKGNLPAIAGSQQDLTTAGFVEMLIQAQEGERQRLARQMHDGPAQALSNFILQTEIVMRLFDLDLTRARTELESLKVAATSTFQKVRDYIFELRPMMLDDLGLVPTIKRYVEIVKEGSTHEITFIATGKDIRLESYQEVMIFRTIQELVYNSLQHSQANVLKLQLDYLESSIKLTVDDDGQGFESEILDQSDGMGLKVIRDRVKMMGGTIEIDSQSGRGTRIMIELPALERKGLTGG